MYMRDRGFAFVEVALVLVVVAIVAAGVIMVFAKPDHANAVAGCQREASAFSDAVRIYHEHHDNKAWPDTNASHSVYAVSLALTIGSNLDSKDPLTYLDGSQRSPVSAARGWTYNFDNHTVDASGCLAAT